MDKLTFIDTHTHLYDEAFSGDAEETVQRAANAGVEKMLLPDVDSRERDAMLTLAKRHPNVLYTMLGLYPGSVGDNWEKEIEKYEKLIPDVRPVAIGEIGLDYHYGAQTAELQKLALKTQFNLAARYGLPVNVHLRDATEDFFAVLDECRSLSLRGDLHAFSGSYETFMRIQNYGDWYVGIGGVLTFKGAKLPLAVERIPLDRIVLETDSPYLTPVPHRGTRNESAYIPLIAERIAQIKGISLEEVALVTTENAKRLFNLPD